MAGDPSTLTVEQGAQADIIFEAFEDEAQTVRTSFTGWNLVMQARRARGDMTTGGLLLNASSTDGTGRLFLETATSGPSGQWVHLRLTRDNTAAIPSYNGFYELARVDAGDPENVQPIVDGQFVVEHRLIQ